MERRTLIAVILSLLILIASDVIMKRLYGPGTEPAPLEPPVAKTLPAEPAEAPAVAPPGEPVAVAAVPIEGRDVVIETDLYRAIFTTAGGRLKSFRLKRYRTHVNADSEPLELIQEASPDDLPLGVQLRGQRSLNDASVLYGADREVVSLTGAQEATVSFTGRLDGTTIVKQIAARGDRYLSEVSVRAEAPPSDVTELGIGWNHEFTPSGQAGQEIVFDAVLSLQGGKLHHDTLDGLAAGKVLENDVGWVGHGGRYFLAALVPADAPSGAPNQLRLWLKQRGQTAEAQLLFPAGVFQARLALYLGPKDIDGLEATGYGLRRAVDLGWFTVVALPLLYAIKFLHRVTHNYGIDIILLTVVIKVAFIPLTRKSFESMKEMQKLQPQMAKIRERLKDKPDEMNKEIMELYRRHKVNPFGGCLPMVLQIPVFVGLYNALLNAVELRHAPFFLWINDLSAPDRLGSVAIPFVEPPGFPVLTLLMGVSMLVQQWMTPAAGDPAQQRIMMIMPMMFTFMFINFPAGLTLYWLVNNILTIAQQYAMNRPQKAAA
jgi:YidC/Oxa1 family membrane protein insertase